MLGIVAGTAIAYAHVGKTPGEILDYLDRRLLGHNRLQSLAKPFIEALRDQLDAPSLAVRNALPFAVPPPPPIFKTELRASVLAPTLPLSSKNRILRVGAGGDVASIAEAARVARDDDIVEIPSGEYFGDVAVWLQKRLVIRGVGGNARIHGSGRAAEGKAIWVIRNGSFLIENVDFVGSKVHDRNGAGIRFEGGRLHVRNCLFWGNENGLLTAWGDELANGELIVEGSEFGYNGAGDGLSHGLYVGRIGRLEVSGSYFHHANVGHLLKSRARRNEIVFSRFSDESGGRASYELDFPNGGQVRLVGNIIQQGRLSENSTMVAYGEEGRTWPDGSLHMANNTMVNEHPHGGSLARILDENARVVAANNFFVGYGRIHAPSHAVTAINNVEAGWEVFRHAARYDYHLSEVGRAVGRIDELRQDSSEAQLLRPKAEYRHPRQVRLLSASAAFVGALQTND